ncbi:MAG: hypothetical protein AB7T07_00945 [Steroidobacteraceae bacterium]
MKRTVTFTVGICIVVAASAIGKSDQPNAVTDSAVAGSGEFGVVSVENLTAGQREVLQAKYRYWPSSTYVAPKAPI